MPSAARHRPVRQHPEPARLWIAGAPRGWRAAAGPWTDLAAGGLGGLRGRREPEWAALLAFDLDDLCYLPPAAPALARQRDLAAASLLETGTPVLLQLRPGESSEVAATLCVVDLLGPLLAGEVERLAQLPPDSCAVWPLIPGITDSRRGWEEGCSRLATAGVRAVQAVSVELAPPARRRLAEERGDAAFDALFHGEPPSERGFARTAAGFGLEIFVPRPPTGGTRRRIANRRVAAELSLCGELWLRLERSVSFGQSLFRAARGAESTPHDLAALAREKNLALMGWLEAPCVELAEEIAGTGTSALYRELLEEYVGSAHSS